DRKGNKFKVINLLFGYSYDQSFKHQSFSISGPVQSFNFNTVEGFNLSINGAYRKRNEEDRSYYTLNPGIRYGFANKQLNGNAAFISHYDRKKFASYTIKAGSDVV